jgi:hypothetical protein
VPEQVLYNPQVGSLLKKVSGKAMSQGMETGFFGNLSFGHTLSE